jgi:hypothetical protein
MSVGTTRTIEQVKFCVVKSACKTVFSAAATAASVFYLFTAGQESTSYFGGIALTAIFSYGTYAGFKETKHHYKKYRNMVKRKQSWVNVYE